MITRRGFISVILIIGIVIMAVAICSTLSGCTRGQARTVSTWQGGLNREWAVNSGAAQIAAYESFFDLYANIIATAGTIQDPLNGMSDLEIGGMRANLRTWIAQYNTDSIKFESMARFKADNLPTRLSFDEVLYQARMER